MNNMYSWQVNIIHKICLPTLQKKTFLLSLSDINPHICIRVAILVRIYVMLYVY
jgi:hypothetical protein